jgi:hypothetical protein
MMLAPLAFLVAFGSVVSCGSDFAPKNAVTGVRILAARAELPYAAPGESVKVRGLAHDGRTAPAAPMRTFFFPAPCVDPVGFGYYGCYRVLESLFPVGVDLTPSLVEGSEISISIPPDALASSFARPGQQERFATAYVFMVACAGHVERVPRRSGLGENALPLGCFDAGGRQLGPEDFVLGYTRIFVFETRRNAIPALDGVVLQGQPVDLAKGIVTGRCVKDENDECKAVKLDVLFNDAAAEVDPDNIDENGKVGRETLYVDWFTTAGKFRTDRKILFDGNRGRTPKTEIDFLPPEGPITGGKIWAILHDNRGGTTWAEVPLEVQ